MGFSNELARRYPAHSTPARRSQIDFALSASAAASSAPDIPPNYPRRFHEDRSADLSHECDGLVIHDATGRRQRSRAREFWQKWLARRAQQQGMQDEIIIPTRPLQTSGPDSVIKVPQNCRRGRSNHSRGGIRPTPSQR